MTPLDFLAVVLPSSGLYCIVELTSPRKQHVYTDTLEEAYAAVQAFDAQEYDVYFALASFNEAGNRTSNNAKNIRSLYVDLDCGNNKGYATASEATTALQEFVQRSGFPNPYVVSSGYGIHAYWPYQNETGASKAKLLADKFKRAVAVSNLQQPHSDHGDGDHLDGERLHNGHDLGGQLLGRHQLYLDPAVTGNSSAVLRVPGTRNWKHRVDPSRGSEPKPVEILAEGETVSFERLYQLVNALLPPEENVPDLFEHLHAPVGGHLPNSALRDLAVFNSETKFADIVAASARGEGCKQIEYYLENASDGGIEPLFRSIISIAHRCSDGPQAIKKLAAMHPYDDAWVRKKVNGLQGPHNCATIEATGFTSCRGCVHHGKITNPLSIGRKLLVTTEPKVIEIKPVPVPAIPAPTTMLRPEPPEGFAWGVAGGIYELKIGDDGVLQPNKNSVLPYYMYVVDLLAADGKHVINFAVERDGGIRHVALPQKCAVSKDETLKALAEQNIIANKMQDAQLFRFVRAAVERHSYNEAAIEVPASCGWQADDTFVFDGRVFTDRGERRFPMPGLENIFRSSEPTGSLEDWRLIINMLVGRQEHQILAMSLVGFGAPLMRFTGLYGMTFHLGSTESGTGKTLAIELAASIWGDPVRSRTTVDTSSIATLNRLGLLGSLPLCTDEITAKNRSDFEWLPGFLFSVTEGHGKERMESGANKERVNTT
jgi:hypothetical protein